MSAAVIASSGGSWMLFAGAGALFLGLFVAIAAVTLPGVRRRRLAREMAVATAETSNRSQMSALGVKAAEFAERGLARHDRDQVVAVALERAGIDMRAPEFVVLAAAASLGAGLVGGMLGGPVVALIGIGLTILAFTTSVSMKASKRRKQFEEQLPDTLSFIAGSLRAGHSLPQAVDSLVQEAQSPTKEEFQRALFETQLGHTLPDSLAALAARIRSEDFDWVVQAIGIQRDVGGDLAAVLDNVTRTIRDRTRIRRQIDTLTAEGRLSAVVLLALPFVVFLFLAIVNPGYVSELTSTFAGVVMLSVAGGLMVVGALWLKRITRLVFQEPIVPIQVFLYAALVVAAVGLCAWALRGVAVDNPARQRKMVRANLGPSVAAAPDMREVVLAQPAWDRVGAPALQKLARLARRVTPAGLLDALEQRRNYAGLDAKWTLERLLAIKGALGVAGLFLGLLVFLPNPSGGTFLLGVSFAGIGFFVMDIFMNMKASERRAEIERAFPNTADQITICVEAGLGLDAAIAHAARTGSGPLADEFDRVLQDVRTGMSRQAALDAFAERTDVADVRYFVRAVGQANRYGVPIVDALRVQATEGRDRRKARAEERAQKTTVKILFPLMFCILPALFVVILGPAVMRIASLPLGG